MSFGFGKIKAKRRLTKSLAIWYHPRYAPSGLAAASRVPNLQLDRSELVIEKLAREGLIGPGDIRPPGRARTRDLLRVHPLSYLEASARPETLAHVFGLPPEAVDVDEMLTAQRFAVGGTLAAALAVACGRADVGVNLGGGFHHAAPEQGSGFCVYNDIAVAIHRLRSERLAERAAIVDLDFHQGDGNIVAFAEDPDVLTYSIHGVVWSHVEAVADEQHLLRTGVGDRGYLQCLERTLPGLLRGHRPDIVFFVAGNDVLAGDRLGDFSLTPRGVLKRDRFVVDTVRELGAPIVITLGGGYSPEAWQCTANLVRWLLTGSARVRVQRPPDVRTHFARIFREIRPVDLQRTDEDPLAFRAEDLLADLVPQSRRRLVLDYYTVPGIEFALERYGLLDDIRRRGFVALQVEVDPSDPTRQILRVRGRKHEEGPVYLLLELVARRRWLQMPPPIDSESVPVLHVEWLLLQDPTAQFSLDRPRLPGQEFPGLGMAAHVLEALVAVCHRLGLEAVVDRPAHYHNAAVPWKRFRFLDPMLEGRLRALREVLADVGVVAGSELIESGALQLADGTTMPWEAGEHILPVSSRVAAYFHTRKYRHAVHEERRRLLAAGLHVEQE